jgi:hypothetical protein
MGYTKLIQSGTLIELYEYEKEPSKHIKTKHRKTAKYQFNQQIKERSSSSIRRAKLNFRRLVRANLNGAESPLLLTLTMYQVLLLTASSRAFTKFINRVRRGQGKEFRYIAVHEFQRRGAVHFHVLIWGLHEAKAKAQSEVSTRYFQRLWLRGFADCVVTDGHPKLAGYLAKYLQKGMQDIRSGHQKAYYASRNLLRPLHVASGNPALVAILKENVVPHVDNLLHSHEFDSQWLGRCNYQSFNSINDHGDRNGSEAIDGGE